MGTKKWTGFDAEKDKIKANDIKVLQERLAFLKRRLTDFKQKWGTTVNWNGNMEDYDKIIELEIKYVNELIQSQIQQSNNAPAKQINPIWWKRSNRLLKYLMDELAKLDMIDRDSPVNKHIKEHFVDKDKKQFTDSIAQNSSGTGNNKGTSKNSKTKPKGHEPIDSIIKATKEQPE